MQEQGRGPSVHSPGPREGDQTPGAHGVIQNQSCRWNGKATVLVTYCRIFKLLKLAEILGTILYVSRLRAYDTADAPRSVESVTGRVNGEGSRILNPTADSQADVKGTHGSEGPSESPRRAPRSALRGLPLGVTSENQRRCRSFLVNRNQPGSVRSTCLESLVWGGHGAVPPCPSIHHGWGRLHVAFTALLQLPEAQGDGHILGIPWGPKQLGVCVEEDQDDPTPPGPPSPPESGGPPPADSPGAERGLRLPQASLPCHLLCRSLPGPVFQTSSNKNKPIK